MQTNPGLLNDLNALVEPDARGDPMSPLRWTCKSLRRLAAELEKLGHKVSHTVVGELLKKQKFSLQANRKTREAPTTPTAIGSSGRQRRGQGGDGREPAGHIRRYEEEGTGRRFQERRPRMRRQGDPEEVRVHDFLIKDLGRAVPYGIYDLAANAGWSTSVDNDTRASTLARVTF